MVLINMLYLARVKKTFSTRAHTSLIFQDLKNHLFCLSCLIISHFSKQAIFDHFRGISVVEITTMWRKRSIKMNKKKLKNKN